ncbi:MAG: prepilin-type N-terminal cleavage/methylation domain-containing protein [Elusimicrobiota bacterium]
MRTGRKTAGYTLTEMMAVMSIVGILSTVAPQLFIQVSRFFRQSQARTEIQRDSRTVFALLGRSLRQAQASTITVDHLWAQPPFSRITFTKKDGAVMSFYQKGTELYQVDGGTKSIAKNLRYLAFTFPHTDDENLLSVALTLEKATYQGQTKALQLSIEPVRVRNE